MEHHSRAGGTLSGDVDFAKLDLTANLENVIQIDQLRHLVG
jgi:hypothetical protein